MKSEFIYETAAFPSCHASTIEEINIEETNVARIGRKNALIAAWFGGQDEGMPDVGIWTSRHVEGSWSAPVEVVNGIQEDGSRFPCWNPVLFQPLQPADAPLILFYKVGPNPRDWWGMRITSSDGGMTWSPPQRLTDGILGPIKNKPVQLADGTILCPSSDEKGGWRVHLERTRDAGAVWQIIGPLNDGIEIGAIQPSILPYPSGRMQLLCRSQQGVIVQCWSDDEGATWSRMQATTLPNPNSGTDAVMLQDGRALLVYNHSTTERYPLNVALSTDGEVWQNVLTLEDQPGEYSYPAVIQTSDGTIHITYTWHRKRIRHVALEPGELSFSVSS